MFKNVTIGVLITVCIMFIFVVSVEGLASSKRIVELEKLSERLQTENTSLKADVSQLKSMSEDIELLKEAMGIDLKASK